MNKDNPPPKVIYLGVEGVNSTYSPESGLPMFRYGIRNQLTWFNSTWLKADPSHGLAKYFYLIFLFCPVILCLFGKNRQICNYCMYYCMYY